MNYTACFTEEQIKRTFTIECFQKDEETFRKTHYPLSFLLRRPGPGSKDKESDETVLLDEWSISFKDRRNTREFIRPYIIWGAPGTGKTELCRLLEIQIKEKNPEYEPIRISKRDLAMGGILGIAQTLSNGAVDIGDTLLPNFGGLGPANMFRGVLDVIEKNGQNPDFRIQSNSEGRNKILEIIGNTIVKNVQERQRLLSEENISQIETEFEFLKDTDAGEHRIIDNDVFIGKVSISNKPVNYALYKHLESMLFGEKAVEKLIYNEIEKINERGKIPVFIFDDVTFVGKHVRDLISVITDISVDKNEYFCDFVIGTTTDFYKKYFTGKAFETAKARMTEIKLSPDFDGANNANWLVGNKGLEHFLDFCLKYISASYVVDGDELRANIPSSFIDGKDIYYPYSKTFLINLYKRIVHEQGNSKSRSSLSPRYIIQALRHSFLPFLQLQELPSSSIQEDFDLETQFFYIDKIDFEKNALYYLSIWWYGIQTGDGIVEITAEMLNHLGLEHQIPSRDSAKTQITYNVVKLSSNTNVANVNRESITTIRPTDHADEELKTRIQKWMNGDKSVEFAKNVLIDGLNSFIRDMNKSQNGDKKSSNYLNRKSSRAIKERVKALGYKDAGKHEADFEIEMLPKKGENSSKIYFLKTTDERIVQDELNPDTLYLYLDVDDYFHFYQLGNKKDVNGESYQHLLYQFGDEIKALIGKQQVLRRKELEEALGSSLEAYMLSLYMVLGKLRYPHHLLENSMMKWTDVYQYFGVSTLNLPAINERDFPQNLQNYLPSDSDFKTAEGIVLGLFTLRGDGSKRGVVDYPLLSKTLQEIQLKDPFTIIMGANLAGIDSRFVILTGDKSFKQYLENLRKSLNSLKKAEWEFNQELYDELTVQMEKVGDRSEFEEKCGEFIETYKSYGTLMRLKSQRLKITQSNSYKKTISELEAISRIQNEYVTGLHSELELAIIRIMCMYRLDALSNESEYIRFLRDLDNALKDIERGLIGEEEYDLEALKDSIDEFSLVASKGGE